MNKNLILTLAVGDAYKNISSLTLPFLKRYAEKINADLMVVDKSNCTTPHWEKLNLIYEQLNKYERIAYIDSDTLIRSDCPSLFDLVPKDRIGLFNEMPWTQDRSVSLIEACKEYDITIKKWNGKYYNTGVMVISRQFRHLFKKPEKESFNFYEQGYINAILAKFIDRAENEFFIFDIPYHYNRMTCMDEFTGEERFASYIIHYAGYPSLEFVTELIKKDIRRWEQDAPEYNYKRHILISVQGGLGDQVCAEPVLRFLKEHVYKEEDVNVVTHWPELFKHLPINVCSHNEFKHRNDTPYYRAISMPGPDRIMYRIVSHLMCHSVDYISMSLLKRTLPNNDKTIHLSYSNEDLESVINITGIKNLSDLVIVHAGRHWESKTFPEVYWQNIIDELQKSGMKVCLIGKDDETRGTVDIELKDGIIDTRNLLSVNELIALISKSKVLITNDSAPLHIAGAFDNGIILIPTCKHPDHLMPYRHGTQNYRCQSLYKDLMCYDYKSQPTEVYDSVANLLPKKWDSYLPEVKEVVESAKKLFKEIN